MDMGKKKEEGPRFPDIKDENGSGKDLEKGVHGSDSSLVDPQLQLAVIDPALEKRVLRKLDLHLMPLVMSLYLFAFLDRSNIGNAAIAGMKDDLDLDSNDYGWFLTIYYVAYITFEPMTLMWKVVPPHMWGAFCVCGWGVASTLQTVAYSWSGMMAARFFLGAFEASFVPGILYFLSFFYLRNELGLRCGLYFGASALASCFSGALAYGITSGHQDNIAPWRLLFLVEGLPVVFAAAVAWFFLPDSPETAKFFTKDELEVVKARNIRQTGLAEGQRERGVSWPEVWAALCDLKLWLTACMVFSGNVSFSSLPVFLPKILADMGFSDINAQGLSAPPYFLAFLGVILSCWIADRTAQRAYTIFPLSILGAVGYIMLATSSSVPVRYAGVYFAASGIFPAIGNIAPWVLNNQGSETRRGTGTAVINIVGQCGPLLGTRLYPAGEGPYYRKGMWMCAAFMIFNAMIFNACLALTLRARVVWENKKLDEKYGTKVEGGVCEENEGLGFRYIL